MAITAQTTEAYQAISVDKNPAGPLVEFCFDVTEQRPSVEEIEALSTQDSALQSNISDAREQMTHVEDVGPVYYFRGSGMIIIGDIEGIRLVDYRATSTLGPDRFGDPGHDPVVEVHGAYQWAALIRLGLAAYVRRLAETQSDPEVWYEKIDTELVTSGLQPAYVPHQLGYAYNPKTGLMAGASGMLVSNRMADAMGEAYAMRTLDDGEKGWLRYGVDTFTGYNSQVAANVAVGLGAAASRVFLRNPYVNIH
ncbi:MAG TPA: hypothetical protein VMB52_02445 [Verrucomicrobiae bacterium]|nr:hypothetical protein [Verrucomicrobiae bacterium]